MARSERLIALLFLTQACNAQQSCSAEVKLLLSPSQVQIATAALDARNRTQGHVYFYDSPALDLYSKGIILRLREGREVDLTAKLRLDIGASFGDRFSGSEHYKCEVDWNDGVGHPSFSIQKHELTARVPATGDQLFEILSSAQRKLLKESGLTIDWNRVIRFADIQSTAWTAKVPSLGKVDIILWEWPSGSVLELSKKVKPTAEQTTYLKMQAIAKHKGLTLSIDQNSKTAITLSNIADDGKNEPTAK